MIQWVYEAFKSSIIILLSSPDKYIINAFNSWEMVKFLKNVWLLQYINDLFSTIWRITKVQLGGRLCWKCVEPETAHKIHSFCRWTIEQEGDKIFKLEASVLFLPCKYLFCAVSGTWFSFLQCGNLLYHTIMTVHAVFRKK